MLRSVVENAGLEYNMCVCALNISAIGYMGYPGYRKSVQLPALADRTCTFIANTCGSVWSTSATLVVYCSFLPIGIYQYKLQIKISTEIYLANLAVLNLVGFRIRVILSAHPVCDSICTSTINCIIHKLTLDLDEGSTVLVFGTEGATDPDVYRALIGEDTPAMESSLWLNLVLH